MRSVRRVVTGALEVVRRTEKDHPDHIGSSLEAAPIVHITDADLAAAVAGLDMAEICITSDITLSHEAPPTNAFTTEDVQGVAVVHNRAKGNKCARSWRVLPEVGSDRDYPDISVRDADAMREIDGKAA